MQLPTKEQIKTIAIVILIIIVTILLGILIAGLTIYFKLK